MRTTILCLWMLAPSGCVNLTSPEPEAEAEASTGAADGGDDGDGASGFPDLPPGVPPPPTEGPEPVGRLTVVGGVR